MDIAELLLVRKSLHRCQLALGLGGHLLALGAWLTSAATSAFCALKQDSGVNVTHLAWPACEAGLRLRVGRIQGAQSRMLLQELLNLRRVLLLQEEFLQVIVVHFHL